MFFIQLIRKHILFIIVIPILIVFMTYPTITFLLDDTTNQLSNDEDAMMKFWDAWYFEELLAGRQDYYFASNLFYPHGIDLSYHSFNLVHMGLIFIVKPFLGIFRAYDAVHLIMILLTSLTGYLYLNFLFKDKMISLLGTIFFVFTPQILIQSAHPDLSSLATIPLALYFVERSIIERHRLFMVIGGVVIGLTVHISFYIYIPLLMIVGFRIMMLLTSPSNYTHKKVWRNLVLLACIVGTISITRVYPMVANSDALIFAVEKDADSFSEKRSDLLMYFVNDRNPLFKQFIVPSIGEPFWQGNNFSYLGYTAIFLSIFGLLHKNYRSKMIFWLLVFAIFFMLRLGSVLTINGEVYSNIILPKEFLDQLLPIIFMSFHVSGHFQIGIGLPLAIMTSYGTFALIDCCSRIPKFFIVMLIIVFAMVEIYVPIKSSPMTDEQLSFQKQLAMSDDVSGALVNLPMGRRESKLYDFYQTFNHLPHAEGLAGRTPSNAYDYIKSNGLLSAWKNDEYVSCRQKFFYFYRDASKLLEDGFQFVVFHKKLFNNPVYDVFGHLAPYYDDEYVRVYELKTLIADCSLDDLQAQLLKNPLEITYVNNLLLILHNVVVKQSDNMIQILFLWERSGEAINEQLSFSLQIFDESGNKVEQQDNYLPLESLDTRNLSIDNLETGAYQVKLVVYNHNTGETQVAKQGSETSEYREITIYVFEVE